MPIRLNLLVIAEIRLPGKGVGKQSTKAIIARPKRSRTRVTRILPRVRARRERGEEEEGPVVRPGQLCSAISC